MATRLRPEFALRGRREGARGVFSERLAGSAPFRGPAPFLTASQMSAPAKNCEGCPSAATCQAAKDASAPCPSSQGAAAPQGGCTPDKCANCPSKGSCGSNMQSPENREIAERLKSVGRVLVVLSGKGGVGKSTIATQLAFYLAEAKGYKVGLMDADICGPSVPTMTKTQAGQVHPTAFGWEAVRVTDNLSVISVGFMLNKLDDPVILRGPKKHGIIAQFLKDVNWQFEANPETVEGESPYAKNILIVDTPPGTSDEHLSVVNTLNAALQILKADPTAENKPIVSAVVVSTPQEVALADVRKEINFCKQIHLDVAGVVENMAGFVCPCCNRETQIFSPGTGGVTKLCEDYSVPYLGRVPLDPILTRASEQGVAWVNAVEEGKECVGLQLFSKIADKLVS